MRSIRGKLLITLLLTAVISTILVGLFILKDSERMTYTMAKDSNSAELRNIRDYYFEKLITDMEMLVAYWSKESALTDYKKAPEQAHITRSIPNNFHVTFKKWISISAASEDITWLYYGLEEDGSIFIAPVDPSMPDDYDARTREWYKQAKADPYVIHWSEPYLDAGQSGKMLQTVSKAVVKDGKVIGVFAIDIEVDRFNEILSKLTYGKNAQLFIVSPKGESLAGSEKSASDIMSLYDLKDLSEEQTLIRKVNGSEIIVTIMPLSTNKWILISAQPLRIESLMNTSKMRVLWAAILQIIVTIILGVAVSGHLFKPLENLLKVIQGVSKGDIKMRSRVASKDEFGALSRGFDTMLDNIEELIYERDHHLKSLKKKNKEIMNGKEEIMAYSSQVEAMNDELSRLLNELGDNYLSTVKALANAIEASDDYTRGHCERVGDISKLLAKHMDMSYENSNDLVYACVLHDIGKIAISDKILNKRMPLTKDELSMIKMHPLIGFEIIKDVHFLEKPSQILLQHHERVDGLGYPYGLAREDILLEARILSVADAYDAMTSVRAYRQIPLTKPEVLEELKKGRGAQFDEEVIDALIDLLNQSEDHL